MRTLCNAKIGQLFSNTLRQKLWCRVTTVTVAEVYFHTDYKSTAPLPWRCFLVCFMLQPMLYNPQLMSGLGGMNPYAFMQGAVSQPRHPDRIAEPGGGLSAKPSSKDLRQQDAQVRS